MPSQEPAAPKTVQSDLQALFGLVRVGFFFLTPLLAAIFLVQSFAREEKPKPEPVVVRKVPVRKQIVQILQIDPAELSVFEFYKFENAILREASDGRGYFLSEEAIDWIKKAVAALEAKGNPPREDVISRGVIFADSYFHLRDYKKALGEYRRCGNSAGVEKVEWYLSNEGAPNDRVKIAEYPGEISYPGFEAARAEDPNYLFVSYFKGPVYRYDKKHDKHAVIWYPPDVDDWSDSLQWNGENLSIGIGKNRKLTFSNPTSRLGSGSGVQAMALSPGESQKRSEEGSPSSVLPEYAKEPEKKVEESEEGPSSGSSGKESGDLQGPTGPGGSPENADIKTGDSAVTSNESGSALTPDEAKKANEAPHSPALLYQSGDAGPAEPEKHYGENTWNPRELHRPSEEDASRIVSVTYPEITSEKLPLADRKAVNLEIKKFWDDLFSKDTGPGRPEGADQAGRRVNFKIICFTPDFLSIQLNDTTLEVGSTRGFTQVYGFNYDFQARKVLKLKDLFQEKSAYREWLSDHVRKDLLEKVKLRGLQQAKLEKFFKNFKMDPESQAFGMTKQGLALYLAPDAIPPYTKGRPEVVIPYEELVFLVKNMVRRLSGNKEAVIARVNRKSSPPQSTGGQARGRG